MAAASISSARSPSAVSSRISSSKCLIKSSYLRRFSHSCVNFKAFEGPSILVRALTAWFDSFVVKALCPDWICFFLPS